MHLSFGVIFFLVSAVAALSPDSHLACETCTGDGHYWCKDVGRCLTDQSECYESVSFTAFCPGHVPLNWSCSALQWGDGECDCQCGAYDPDCDASVHVYGCANADACCANAGTRGGICGTFDADSGTCVVEDEAGSCLGSCGQPSVGLSPTCSCASDCEPGRGGPASCCPDFSDYCPELAACAPGCTRYYVGDGICDSRCYNEECEYDGGDCDAVCSPGCEMTWPGDGYCDDACNNAACGFDGGDCAVPEGWTCSPEAFSDDVCDCECGVFDAACADLTLDVVGCSGDGACCLKLPDGTSKCGAVKEDTGTQTCVAGAPIGWTCPPSYYANGGECNCDCGIYDPDCENTDAELAGCAKFPTASCCARINGLPSCGTLHNQLGGAQCLPFIPLDPKVTTLNIDDVTPSGSGFSIAITANVVVDPSPSNPNMTFPFEVTGAYLILTSGVVVDEAYTDTLTIEKGGERVISFTITTSVAGPLAIGFSVRAPADVVDRNLANNFAVAYIEAPFISRAQFNPPSAQIGSFGAPNAVLSDILLASRLEGAKLSSITYAAVYVNRLITPDPVCEFEGTNVTNFTCTIATDYLDATIENNTVTYVVTNEFGLTTEYDEVLKVFAIDNLVGDANDPGITIMTDGGRRSALRSRSRSGYHTRDIFDDLEIDVNVQIETPWGFTLVFGYANEQPPVTVEDAAFTTCYRIREGSWGNPNRACPSGHVISRFKYIAYGVFYGSCPNYGAHCAHASAHLTSAVKGHCGGGSDATCGLLSSHNWFGIGDPCPGIVKDLMLVFECSPISQRLMFDIQIGNTPEVTCPTGHAVADVPFAFWGWARVSKTMDGALAYTQVGQACASYDKSDVVKTLCLGEESCSVPLNTGTFGGICRSDGFLTFVVFCRRVTSVSSRQFAYIRGEMSSESDESPDDGDKNKGGGMQASYEFSLEVKIYTDNLEVAVTGGFSVTLEVGVASGGIEGSLAASGVKSGGVVTYTGTLQFKGWLSMMIYRNGWRVGCCGVYIEATATLTFNLEIMSQECTNVVCDEGGWSVSGNKNDGVSVNVGYTQVSIYLKLEGRVQIWIVSAGAWVSGGIDVRFKFVNSWDPIFLSLCFNFKGGFSVSIDWPWPGGSSDFSMEVFSYTFCAIGNPNTLRRDARTLPSSNPNIVLVHIDDMPHPDDITHPISKAEADAEMERIKADAHNKIGSVVIDPLSMRHSLPKRADYKMRHAPIHTRGKLMSRDHGVVGRGVAVADTLPGKAAICVHPDSDLAMFVWPSLRDGSLDGAMSLQDLELLYSTYDAATHTWSENRAIFDDPDHAQINPALSNLANNDYPVFLVFGTANGTFSDPSSIDYTGLEAEVALNSNDLMYSIYNATASSWSTPQYLAHQDNGIADTDVKTYGDAASNTVAVVWVRSNNIRQTNFSIVLSAYDVTGESWTTEEVFEPAAEADAFAGFEIAAHDGFTLMFLSYTPDGLNSTESKVYGSLGATAFVDITPTVLVGVNVVGRGIAPRPDGNFVLAWVDGDAQDAVQYCIVDPFIMDCEVNYTRPYVNDTRMIEDTITQVMNLKVSRSGDGVIISWTLSAAKPVDGIDPGELFDAVLVLDTDTVAAYKPAPLRHQLSFIKYQEIFAPEVNIPDRLFILSTQITDPLNLDPRTANVHLGFEEFSTREYVSVTDLSVNAGAFEATAEVEVTNDGPSPVGPFTVSLDVVDAEGNKLVKLGTAYFDGLLPRESNVTRVVIEKFDSYDKSNWNSLAAGVNLHPGLVGRPITPVVLADIRAEQSIAKAISWRGTDSKGNHVLMLSPAVVNNGPSNATVVVDLYGFNPFVSKAPTGRCPATAIICPDELVCNCSLPAEEQCACGDDSGDLGCCNCGCGTCAELCEGPPAANCSDGKLNGDEEGVDCGGSCDACDSFVLGMCLTNDTACGMDVICDCRSPFLTCSCGEEAGFDGCCDCGCGTCAEICANAPPACYDGAKNGDETGIDCGGSCPACDEPWKLLRSREVRARVGSTKLPIDVSDFVNSGDPAALGMGSHKIVIRGVRGQRLANDITYEFSTIHLPDINIDAVNVSVAVPGNVSISVALKNNGVMPTQEFEVEVGYDGEVTQVYLVPRLPSFASRTHIFAVPGTFSAGMSYNVFANAVPAEGAYEYTESNNFRSRNVTVLRRVDIDVSEVTFSVEDPRKVTIQVTNNGEGAALLVPVDVTPGAGVFFRGARGEIPIIFPGVSTAVTITLELTGNAMFAAVREGVMNVVVGIDRNRRVPNIVEPVVAAIGAMPSGDSKNSPCNSLDAITDPDLRNFMTLMCASQPEAASVPATGPLQMAPRFVLDSTLRTGEASRQLCDSICPSFAAGTGGFSVRPFAPPGRFELPTLTCCSAPIYTEFTECMKTKAPLGAAAAQCISKVDNAAAEDSEASLQYGDNIDDLLLHTDLLSVLTMPSSQEVTIKATTKFTRSYITTCLMSIAVAPIIETDDVQGWGDIFFAASKHIRIDASADLPEQVLEATIFLPGGYALKGPSGNTTNYAVQYGLGVATYCNGDAEDDDDIRSTNIFKYSNVGSKIKVVSGTSYYLARRDFARPESFVANTEKLTMQKAEV